MNTTVLTALIAVGLVLAAFLVVWLLAHRGRAQRVSETVRFAGLRGAPRAKPGFVGRTGEIDAFADLLAKRGKYAEAQLRLLVVIGEAGIGKRELLEQYRVQCEQSRNACVGAWFDLDRDTGGPEKVMRDLAAGLEHLERGSAAQFHSRLQRLDDHRSERASPLQSAVQAAQGAATTLEQIGLPGAKVVAAGATSGFVDQAVAQLDFPVDVESLAHVLVDDLLRLAARRPDAPIVLFLADLDAHPGDLGAAWLRETLLPRLGEAPVLVIASVRSPSTEDQLTRLLQPAASHRLGPLVEEDRRRYAREVIKLKEASAVEQVVDRSRPGSPKRLEAIRRQIETNPELVEEKTLPDWVFTEAGAELARRLHKDAEHPLDGRVLQAAALLRWFNTELLADVATAAGVHSEDSGLDVTSIIERARAAPTVRAKDRGWALSDDRRAIADELRRLSPDVWRAVHKAAARSHHRRLTGVDGSPTVDEMLAWAPPDDLDERVRDREWLDALLERQYHLLALRPRDAVRSVCDVAATMLYLEADEAAHRLLGLEVERDALGHNRVYLALMFRVAWALSEGRVTDASTALRELASCGGPTPLVTAAVRFRLGIIHQLMGDYGDSLASLQAALDILADGSFPLQPRLSAMTAAWLAWVEAAGGAPLDDAIRRLDEASQAATPLDDLRLSTWIEHLRARTQETFGDPVEARANYDEVVAAYERLARPKEIATVRLSRALVLERLGDHDGAQEDVGVAESIVQELGDDAQRAEVEVVRTLMALAARDLETADEHSRLASALRPNDHGLLDQLGRCFYSAGFPAESRRLHERAIELTAGADSKAAGDGAPSVGGVAVYHVDLAYALLALGENDAAATELDNAARLGPDNPEPLRALLRLQGADPEAAAATAERLAAVIQRRAAAWGRGRDQADVRLMHDQLDALDEATHWLPTERAIEVLERLIELVPADPRLRYKHFSVLASLPAEQRDADPSAVLSGAVDRLTDDDPPKMRHEYLVDLAERLVREHDLQKAIRVLERAAETGVTTARRSKLSLRVERLARWERASFAAMGSDDWVPRIRVDVAEDLSDWFDPGGDTPQALGARKLFETMLPELREEVRRRTGVRLPSVNFRAATDLAPRSLRIAIDHVERSTAQLAGDELTQLLPDEVRARTGADAVAGVCPWNDRPASWIGSATADALRADGVETWDPRAIACAMLVYALDFGDLARLLDVRQAAELLGESTDARVDTRRRATLVLRHLAADGVPIGDADTVRRLILDAPPDAAARDIAEQARALLIGEALAGWARDCGGSLPVIELSPEAQARIAGGTRLRRSGNAAVVALDGPTRAALTTALGTVDADPPGLVAVDSADTRAALSASIRAARLTFRAVQPAELDGIDWQRSAVLELPGEPATVEARQHA